MPTNTNPTLKYWLTLFNLPEDLITLAYDCIPMWPDARTGERELFFFLRAMDLKTQKSIDPKTGKYRQNAPCFADRLSIKISLKGLAESGASFDEIMPTAYFVVRYDKASGTYNLIIGSTYKWRVLQAKHKSMIDDIQVNLVFSKDKFNWRGNNLAPTHHYDVFMPLKERGNVVSGYSITYKKDGTVYADSVTLDEIMTRYALAEDPKIAKQWKEKMLLKVVVNEAEKVWHYTRQADTPSNVIKRDKLADCMKAINDCNAIPPSLSTDKAFKTAMAYSVGFYADHVTGIEQMENLVFSIVGKSDLVESSHSSLIAILLTIEKYYLSLAPSKSHCFIYGKRVNNQSHANLQIMYLGMREIAFTNIFNSPQGVVDKIDYTLVHKNDSFKYHGRHKKPSFKFNPKVDRGDVIGGFVVTERSGKTITTIVRNDYLNKIADCAKTQTVKNKWPKKYAEKSILKQCFFEWL